MSLAPLLQAHPAIQLHAFAAMSAFALGILQLSAPKGTIPHRAVGWLWVALMALVAASSFLIHDIRLWGLWSPIHIISIAVLIMLPLAVFHARRHKVRRHAGLMIGMFVGGLIIAGLFTFVPGRIMNAVAFGG